MLAVRSAHADHRTPDSFGRRQDEQSHRTPATNPGTGAGRPAVQPVVLGRSPTASSSSIWGNEHIPGTRQATADLSFLGVDGAEQPNAEAYRRTADAFRSGDLTPLSSLIDADVVWHVPGRYAMACDIHGRDALLAWFGLLRPKGFWLSEHDVFGNDEHVCALSVMGARRHNVDVQIRVVSVFHYREGRQLERWFYPEDSAAWDAIFAD